jgi:hypothetical protein
MNRESTISMAIVLIAATALVGRAAFTAKGMGRQYVHAVSGPNGQIGQYEAATQAEYQRAVVSNPNQNAYQLSMPRTIGLWVAAFFTLAIFSFLYRDNPFYRIAEAVLVGVSAAYWMVIGFWDVLVPNLLGKIWPAVVQSWAMPGLSGPEAARNLWYVVPLLLGVMLLWSLSPKGAWIARWPLAFVIGTTAGLRMIGFLHGDFLAQIRSSIVPLVVITSGAFDPWQSMRNVIVVVAVLCCLVYFLFSFEHTGVVGKAAKVGMWVLMITFGASFGYTVMGRIALLAIRIEFLLDDWLWLIDPIHRRAVATILRVAFGHA